MYTNVLCYACLCDDSGKLELLSVVCLLWGLG